MQKYLVKSDNKRSIQRILKTYFYRFCYLECSNQNRMLKIGTRNKMLNSFELFQILNI